RRGGLGGGGGSCRAAAPRLGRSLALPTRDATRNPKTLYPRIRQPGKGFAMRRLLLITLALGLMPGCADGAPKGGPDGDDPSELRYAVRNELGTRSGR